MPSIATTDVLREAPRSASNSARRPVNAVMSYAVMSCGRSLRTGVGAVALVRGPSMARSHTSRSVLGS